MSPIEYRSARLDLLAKEKELTRARDALTAERQALPIVEVTKDYAFTAIGPNGEKTAVNLSDLFDGRPQLVIYHFMFAPDWEAGCPSCSLLGDSVPPLEHLHSRSTSFVAVSRAPIEKIEAYKKRQGWKFPWVSSHGTDFNYDFGVTQDETVRPVEYNFRSKEEMEKRGQPYFATGEQPGHSCFVKGGGNIGEEGKIYHTYSSYARGGEPIINTYTWLDMTILGRQDGKTGLPGLGFKRRDEYTGEDLKGL